MCYRIIFGLVIVCVSDFFELHCACQTRGHPFKLCKERSYSSVRASYCSVGVINVWNSVPADCVDFSSFAAFKKTIEQIDFSQFFSAMTTELVLAELLCCDCECVFCNFLVFYVSAFYFILWAVVSAGYSALLSSSYFERINDDDDDDNMHVRKLELENCVECSGNCRGRSLARAAYWILCGVALLGDYGLLSLTVCNSTSVPPRLKATIEH